MATRAEQARVEAQRSGRAKRERSEPTARPRATTRSGAKTRGSAKATFAREPRSAAGRATRKSTRAAANRSKPESTMEIREELQKGTPTARFRRASAASACVGGEGDRAPPVRRAGARNRASAPRPIAVGATSGATRTLLGPSFLQGVALQSRCPTPIFAPRRIELR